jgi:MFS family permease
MNTPNAAGYLIGAIVAEPVGRRMGDKRVFAFSLVLAALTVGGSGLTADFTALLLLRAAAGFTGALAFVCGAGLASAAAMGGSKHRAPTLLRVYFAGAGMGITASLWRCPPCWGQLDGAAAGLSWARLRLAPCPSARDPWAPKGSMTCQATRR